MGVPYEFDDGRARNGDTISFRAPFDMRADLKRAAAAEQISLNEFLRRAARDRVECVTGRNDNARQSELRS
jgi:uncharacterized protein (DUF1778 family)